MSTQAKWGHVWMPPNDPDTYHSRTPPESEHEEGTLGSTPSTNILFDQYVAQSGVISPNGSSPVLVRDQCHAELRARLQVAYNKDAIPQVPRSASNEVVAETLRDAWKRHGVEGYNLEVLGSILNPECTVVKVTTDGAPWEVMHIIWIQSYAALRASCDAAAADDRVFFYDRKQGPSGEFPFLGPPKS